MVRALSQTGTKTSGPLSIILTRRSISSPYNEVTNKISTIEKKWIP